MKIVVNVAQLSLKRMMMQAMQSAIISSYQWISQKYRDTVCIISVYVWFFSHKFMDGISNCFCFFSLYCTYSPNRRKDYTICISMHVQTTKEICSHWILKWVLSYYCKCFYWIQIHSKRLIVFQNRLTLRRKIKTIICQPVKCRCLNFISWCHWFSFYPDYFGCSSWRRARTYFSFLPSSSIIINIIYLFIRHTVFRIHYIMGILVFLKALSLMFHSINYHFIDKKGEHIEAWAILFYITHL